MVPAGDDIGYAARRITDGDIIDAGTFRLRAIHTPGHTREHVSYALDDESGETVGVFTGGSMLFDSTGRTDLLGEDSARELTTAQYHSVKRLAAELPADADVYPTHGFGSFCAASATGRDASTVGEQRDSNPALTQDEAEFVDELLANLAEYPAYYEHMGVINRAARMPSTSRRLHRSSPRSCGGASRPVSGWWTCATERPSPRVISAAPTDSSCRTPS